MEEVSNSASEDDVGDDCGSDAFCESWTIGSIEKCHDGGGDEDEGSWGSLIDVDDSNGEFDRRSPRNPTACM